MQKIIFKTLKEFKEEEIYFVTGPSDNSLKEALHPQEGKLLVCDIDEQGQTVKFPDFMTEIRKGEKCVVFYNILQLLMRPAEFLESAFNILGTQAKILIYESYNRTAGNRLLHRIGPEFVWNIFNNFRTRIVMYGGEIACPHFIFGIACPGLLMQDRSNGIIRKITSCSTNTGRTFADLSTVKLSLDKECFKFDKIDLNFSKCPAKYHFNIESLSLNKIDIVFNDINLSGWCLGEDHFNLQVYLNGRFIGAPIHGEERKDVYNYYKKNENALFSGFSFKIKKELLNLGMNSILLVLQDKGDSKYALAEISSFFVNALSVGVNVYKSIPLYCSDQHQFDRFDKFSNQVCLASQKNVFPRFGGINKKKKSKILLIYPTFASVPEKPTTHDRVILHGIGLISSNLKANGHEPEFLDNRILNSWDIFEKELEKKQADIIGISSSSSDYSNSLKCIPKIKRYFPESKIIMGGAHPSLATQHVCREENIDHIIIGDGELSFLELVKLCEEGRQPPRIIHGKKCELDLLPFVDRDIFQTDEHLSDPLWFGEKPWVSMITSRGCLFNCSFCAPASKIMFGKKVRRRSPENVMEEIMILYNKYRFKHIRFYDDNIIENSEWANNFCDLFAKSSLPDITFGIAGRSDLICKRESLIKKLAEVGMNELNIGFESGSQKILDMLNKRTSVEENIKAAQILKKYNVNVIVSVMFGIPGETKADIKKTIELLDNVKPDWIDPAFLTPYPGTYIYNYCMEKKLLLEGEGEYFKRDLGSMPKLKGIDYDYIIEALGNRYGPRS